MVERFHGKTIALRLSSDFSPSEYLLIFMRFRYLHRAHTGFVDGEA